MRPGWLAVLDLPVAAKIGNRQVMAERYGEGTEALASLAIEPHGRLRKGVAVASFTRFKRLDAVAIQNIDVVRDP
jgi:hypothetical protein